MIFGAKPDGFSPSANSGSSTGAFSTGRRFQINLTWLLKLRWLAVGGQVVTIFGARVVLDLDMPLDRLLPIIAVAAITNAGLEVWMRGRLAREDAPFRGRGEWILASIMVLDIVALSALLYVSGGTDNPFSLFYLVNIALATTLLKPIWAWLITGLAVCCFISLYFFHQPLPALREPVPFRIEGDFTSVGMLVAVAGAATILVYFMTRVKGELARSESRRRHERQRQAQVDKFEALATLAAGAAHELATPLSTIAVISKELELELERSGPLPNAIEDAQLVRREVDRCRAILDQMSLDAGETVGEEMLRIGPEEWLRRAIDALRERARVVVDLDEDAEKVEMTLPVRATTRAVRSVVKNGLDASPSDQEVRVRCSLDGQTLVVNVRDRGTGMDPETVKRAMEPFYTTKEPGRGMGLGLFLARSVIDRIGGTLVMDSQLGVGTSVTIRIPLEGLGDEDAAD